MAGRGAGQWGTVENRGVVRNGGNDRTERGGVKRSGKRGRFVLKRLRSCDIT